MTKTTIDLHPILTVNGLICVRLTQGYIQLVNPNAFAIDVSNYKVSGGAGGPQITLAPGMSI